MDTTETEVVEKQYPTAPDADGFYFENEADAELSIQTKVYDNGSKIKECLLPKCGKTAVVRELTAKETKDVRKFLNNKADENDFQIACITVATTLDGNKETFEFFENLKQKDYGRLLSMYSDLNF